MKRKIAGTFLLAGLVMSMAVPVHAETYSGDPNWGVTFTGDNKMESNFSLSDINDLASGMQPGDNTVITLKVRNDNGTAVDWYMRNEVLSSLEDGSQKNAKGGAYTYRLVYTDKSGTPTELYNSDTVGGDAGTNNEEIVNRMGGLRSATSSLKEFFYLDTLSNGEGGYITLEVALDGEAEGNAFQQTLADLNMDFAVELRSNPPGDRRSRRDEEPGTNPPPASNVAGTGVVQTNDDNPIILYSALLVICGIMLLTFCIWNWRAYRKRREEA